MTKKKTNKKIKPHISLGFITTIVIVIIVFVIAMIITSPQTEHWIEKVKNNRSIDSYYTKAEENTECILHYGLEAGLLEEIKKDYGDLKKIRATTLLVNFTSKKEKDVCISLSSGRDIALLVYSKTGANWQKYTLEEGKSSPDPMAFYDLKEVDVLDTPLRQVEIHYVWTGNGDRYSIDREIYSWDDNTKQPKLIFIASEKRHDKTYSGLTEEKATIKYGKMEIFRTGKKIDNDINRRINEKYIYSEKYKSFILAERKLKNDIEIELRHGDTKKIHKGSLVGVIEDPTFYSDDKRRIITPDRFYGEVKADDLE